MTTPKEFMIRSVPRSGRTAFALFRDSNGLKNILHQNSLLIWILLSVSVHLAGLVWCPGPRLRTFSQPNYLMVDLIYGVTISHSGPLSTPEPAGDKTYIESAKTISEKPETPAPSHHPVKSNSNNKKSTDVSPPKSSIALKPLSKAQGPPAENSMRLVAQGELKASHNTVEPQISSPMQFMGSQEETGSAVNDSAPNEETGLISGQGATGNLAQGGPVGEGAPVDTPLAYGDNPPPPYPSTARRRGWEGEVRLLVNVTATGRVSKVAISQSSGYQILDRAAANSVYRWRFQAAMRNGREVPGQVMVPIRFSIKDTF